MENIRITAEDAFEVGVKEGRKQMATHILEMLEITNDSKVITKYIQQITQDKTNEVKQFFKDIRSE